MYLNFWPAVYVDDVLFGHHDIAELKRIRDQLIGLLNRGGFELRKWVLGIGWNPRLDVFQVAVSVSESVLFTKRAILSTIARLFDPLGWVVPATISTKIILQQLWRSKVGWDDPIPETIACRWNSIYGNLSQLNQVRLNRWAALELDSERADLHGFSDASNVAYAAAVYLRVVSRSGDVKVTLLAAKSRVAPVNSLTVPRLELCAAVLLSRLMEFVRDALEIDRSSCICWTDTIIVLAWLDCHPSHWKTFVANRVAEIRSRLPDVDWRYVPTAENPADCASQGLLGSELLSHSLWWHGPPWLRSSANSWPQVDRQLPATSLLETKPHCGVDYAGPILVRSSPGRGHASRKAYVALFICLATRAVHLELVSDYSSPTFLHAFSRFCSRRGLPSSVYSDNGTTFVGADCELTAAYRTAIRNTDFQNSIAQDNVA
ncbi:hypothetical protein DMN91_004688 [Ooceraea biroi]|uniref:Integrase catalytic domain-containing protein n=1 Tax=Ooceraea biroi TaxID=2015173 RepID=A0A3L8DPQ2_OOCBI|nr:uncharacterized protein LOC113561958 [Ooceraea biroi]RLU22410.1 hypothetical protein DMN91_004688 [Ooceraea biroi]